MAGAELLERRQPEPHFAVGHHEVCHASTPPSDSGDARCVRHVERCGSEGGRAVARRNLTVQLDDDIIAAAKRLAEARGTSISALVAFEIDRLVADHDRYERARDLALRALGDALATARPDATVASSPEA
jgi:hypothetical protein